MSTLPEFTKDVEGKEYGGAYYHDAEYRIRMAVEDDQPETPVVLWVEDSAGNRIDQQWLTPELIEGIIKIASINHGLDGSGYDDDWTFPVGMDRVLVWAVTTKGNHRVEVGSDVVDEVAAWLRYATGEDEWTGGEDWEF